MEWADFFSHFSNFISPMRPELYFFSGFIMAQNATSINCGGKYFMSITHLGLYSLLVVAVILITPFAMAFPLTIRPVNSFHQATSHLFSDAMSHDRTKKPTKLSTLRHTLKQKRTNNKKTKILNKNKYDTILHNQIKQKIARSEPNLVVNLSNITLTDSQINVLNKGLKFIPTPKSDTIHTGVKSF